MTVYRYPGDPCEGCKFNKRENCVCGVKLRWKWIEKEYQKEKRIKI